ncbi:MAG TPA: aminoacyl-tRNA hydrolase [Candidatus Saccharimonadales bacterium]
MKLIAGLGNSRERYEGTRHNAGLMAVRWLAMHWRLESDWVRSIHHAQAYIARITEPDVLLAQPTTMMNESGRAIRALMDYYKIPVSDLIIIHDDADLKLGEIKKTDSTTTGAGHHGVLSVIEHVGPGFKRIRIGIGRPQQPMRDISGYVLGRLSPGEKDVLEQALASRLEQLLDC